MANIETLANWPTMTAEQRRAVLDAALSEAERDHKKEKAGERIALAMTGRNWDLYALIQADRRQGNETANTGHHMDQFVAERRRREAALNQEEAEARLSALVERVDPMAQYEAEMMVSDRAFFGPGE